MLTLRNKYSLIILPMANNIEQILCSVHFPIFHKTTMSDAGRKNIKKKNKNTTSFESYNHSCFFLSVRSIWPWRSVKMDNVHNVPIEAAA